MRKAYGDVLCRTTVPETTDKEWIRRWLAITHLKGRLYHVPGGSIGRKYVDLLSTEISYLAAGNYSSERLMVFSAVILQRNRMVRKGADIREVMEKRKEKWTNEEYDILVDEAVICDKAFKTQPRKKDGDHFIKIFTRLVLQGKTRAAVRWLSEQSKGLVLPSSRVIDVKNQDGSLSSMSVLEALKLKHHTPQCPPEPALIKCPSRMDLTITGAHIHFVASRIQGNACPSGTDAGHWQDVLLHYGGHSDRLRDSVATLVRRLSNNIVPWEDIRALMACRLIALDKCPGIRQIGIGETLRRIIGKTVYSVTRYDLKDICGITQLCGGVRCGIEAAIHAVSDLFRNNEADEWEF